MIGEITAARSNAIIWKMVKFSAIFIPYLESTKIFSHFEKKYQLHSLNILEVIDPQNCGYFNTPKFLF